jgi:uncharacterized protein (TIGR02246 family)
MNKLIFPFLLFSFYYSAGQTKKEEEQLIRLERNESNEAIAKKDVEGMAKFWMNDFVQVRGNGTFLVGKDSIMATWKKMFQSTPETSFKRQPSEITISEYDPNMAWETGTWVGINTYSQGGQYSAMWKKQKGMWKLQSELFVALKKKSQ